MMYKKVAVQGQPAYFQDNATLISCIMQLGLIVSQVMPTVTWVTLPKQEVHFSAPVAGKSKALVNVFRSCMVMPDDQRNIAGPDARTAEIMMMDAQRFLTSDASRFREPLLETFPEAGTLLSRGFNNVVFCKILIQNKKHVPAIPTWHIDYLRDISPDEAQEHVRHYTTYALNLGGHKDEGTEYLQSEAFMIPVVQDSELRGPLLNLYISTLIEKHKIPFVRHPQDCWSKSVGSIHRSAPLPEGKTRMEERVFCLISEDRAGCVIKKQSAGHVKKKDEFIYNAAK